MRLRFARFLHKEVAIRNAQLCKELRLLPFGLAETSGVGKVIKTFSSYVDQLAARPAPDSEEGLARFSDELESILEDGTGVVRELGNGVREVREAMGVDGYEDVRSEVDLILDRFFMKRVGLRFLLQHYIASRESPDGVSGIIHSHVAVGPILREAAKEAQQLCIERYGVTPEVRVVGDGLDDGFPAFGTTANLDLSHNRQFTYVPIHLQFSCAVLLQNACYAVAHLHTRGENSKQEDEEDLQWGEARGLPEVKAIFAYGEDEVTVKVSDEGGGIPHDDVPFAWSYFSAPDESPEMPGRGRRHSSPLGNTEPGAGLPLARLHARYYGGDLVLKPIQGFGTDAYLIMSRLGQNCENLPYGVRVSPAMRDSSVGDDASIFFDSLHLTEPEANFLSKRLHEYRSMHAADTSLLDSTVDF